MNVEASRGVGVWECPDCCRFNSEAIARLGGRPAPTAAALCAQHVKGIFGELRFPWEDQKIESYCPAVRVEFCPW